MSLRGQLRASIGGVAVCGKQEGNVIVRFVRRNQEGDFDKGVKTLQTFTLVVHAGGKASAIDARQHGFTRRQKELHTAIRIRLGCIQRLPLAFRAAVEFDCDAACRLACVEVENVRGDAHEALSPSLAESHFCRRRCVISRCCSADSCNSASGVLRMRRASIASICLAVFPVAQTMKMRLNFAS